MNIVGNILKYWSNPDLAAEFRNPDGQDVAIEDLLAVEEILRTLKRR